MKKIWLYFITLVLLSSFVCIPVGNAEDQYEVTLVTNCWDANTGFNGVTLYSPYIKVQVRNLQSSAASKISVHAVFYDMSEMSVWSDETVTLVSSSDTPLKSGFSKTAFIRSSVGYQNKIDEIFLPSVKVEIYINGEYYGDADIARTYSNTTVNQKLVTPAPTASPTPILTPLPSPSPSPTPTSTLIPAQDADDNSLIEQTIISGLPGIFITPTPEQPKVKALPDPAAILGYGGALTYTNFEYNGKEYSVRQFEKPQDIEGFFMEYNDTAVNKGYTVDVDESMGTPAFRYENCEGQDALLLYDYGGLMLLMIEDGLVIKEYRHVRVGSTIQYDSYEQDGDESNGKEPIEWLVLDYDSSTNQALLISRYALDARAYNTEYVDITWEKCTLRAWLNNEFINAAFTAEEQMAIPAVTVKAEKNPKYDTDPGRDTQDRVFLLSINEVNKYFKTDDARMCAPTDYAISQGAMTFSSYAVDGRATCWWWLRSPGSLGNRAARVTNGGSVNTFGSGVDCSSNAVRPALHLDLNLIP